MKMAILKTCSHVGSFGYRTERTNLMISIVRGVATKYAMGASSLDER